MSQTSQAQLWTRQRFGYGLYVVTAMGDTQALNHAWYLQNMQPGVPNFATQWSWTEFDWEFVPGVTAATPVNRIVGNGSALPFTSVTANSVEMTSYAGEPGPLQETASQQTDDSVASAVLSTQWAWNAANAANIGGQLIKWPAVPSDLESPWNWLVSQLYLRPADVATDRADGWKDLSTFTSSSIGWGYPYYPVASTALMSPPTYGFGSTNTATQLAFPDVSSLGGAISVNVINAPEGTTPLIAYDTATGDYSVPTPHARFIPVLLNDSETTTLDPGPPVPDYLWQFYYAQSQPGTAGSPPTPAEPVGALSPGAASFPGRQSFVYAAGPGVFDPATTFYDYTIEWTPDRVAFYILPAGQGASIAGKKPVYVLECDQNPTVRGFGPGAPAGRETFWFQGYEAPVRLGDVFLSFQLWNMNGSFSGTQTGNGSMYVRGAEFYPFVESDADTLFADKPALSVDFTTFTSNQEALAALTREFSLLNGPPAAFYYRADNVAWTASAPDGKPALQLDSVLSDGGQAEWYALSPAGFTGSGSADLKQQVVAQICGAYSPASEQLVTYAAASSGEAADTFLVQGASPTTPISVMLCIKNPASGAEACAWITFTSDNGVTAPAYTIGTPTPQGSTTPEQATQLFAGLSGVPASTTIAPQLYTPPS